MCWIPQPYRPGVLQIICSLDEIRVETFDSLGKIYTIGPNRTRTAH